MACHEVAALRLGLMGVIGIRDEAAKQHEIAEIGEEALGKPGPIRSLASAESLMGLKKYYEAALTDLEQKVASAPDQDPQLPYYRSLLVLTKKVELELRNTIQGLERFYQDLDEMHDFVHEIYPAG
jgi:hypothetical protein